MPIRINLLSEALAAEELRRRDPAKRAAFIGGLLVVLSLVWYSFVILEGKMDLQNKVKYENEIQTSTNGFAQVQADARRVADGQRRLVALQQLSTNRFLYGTLLNALQQVYVPNVQLIRIKVDQGCTVKEGSAGQTNAYGVVAGRPATSTEHLRITLDAKDSSPNPGDGVNRYKDALAQFAYFKSALNRTNGVRLVNTSGTQPATVNGKPYVQFILECNFPDKTR